MEMQIALAAYDPCNEPKRVRAEKMTENHCPVVPEPCKKLFSGSNKALCQAVQQSAQWRVFRKDARAAAQRELPQQPLGRSLTLLPGGYFWIKAQNGFGSILHFLSSVASFLYTSDGAQWPNLSVRRRSLV